MSYVPGVTPVWPYYSERNTRFVGSTGGDELGKDAFLKILVTQLANQDPLQPMQDREYIAQMAQFSSLEQMRNIATEISLMRQSLGTVSGLIGQSVSWFALAENGVVEVTGIVEAVVNKGGELYVVVEGQEIPLADLYKVGAKADES